MEKIQVANTLSLQRSLQKAAPNATVVVSESSVNKWWKLLRIALSFKNILSTELVSPEIVDGLLQNLDGVTFPNNYFRTVKGL